MKSTTSKSCTLGGYYRIFGENRFLEDIGVYRTYGIIYNLNEEEFCFHDISVNMEQVEHMVMLFNQHQLQPVHFYDVVEDMLG
ncbi:hypothetical protein AGMMS50284_6960 [Clostridia bacterium]|nr:hypothetical protein AGMMS50284_6960 [Clostridia bacterium]